MFITAPTVSPDAYDRLIATFEGVVTDNGGTIIKINKWGRRPLAYEVERFREGIYTIFEFEAPGELVQEFERRLKLNDSVLKFLTVKTDRKDRLVNKGTALRKAKAEAKSKRRASRSGERSHDRSGDRAHDRSADRSGDRFHDRSGDRPSEMKRRSEGNP